MSFTIASCVCDGQGRCCGCVARLELLRIVERHRRWPPMVLCFDDNMPDPMPGEGPYDSED